MVAQVDKKYIQMRPTRLWSRLLSYGLFEGRPLTTRGQWINPLVFGLYGLQRRLPQLKRVEAPVFILGTGRSGTTILGIVLSMHRQVGFLNEPKAIWHALHGGEDLIGSYSRGAARYRLGAEDATPAMRLAAHRIYGAYLRTTFTERVVDKYPELVFRYPFVKALFPDARFLFLSRDGWETCNSIEQWSRRLGKDVSGEVHDWWGANDRKWELLVNQLVPEHADLALHQASLRTLRDHRARAAVEWVVTMREGLRLAHEHVDDVLHVSYEGLCEQPVAMARRIAEFIGLEEDGRYLAYAGEVLAPPRSHGKFTLPDYLEEPFAQVQRALGRSA